MTYNIIDVIITLASNSFEDTKLHEIYFADISLFLFLIKKEKNIKILNLMLVVFTIIIAISSMYRMHIYEMEYGLTYLIMLVYIILII